MTRRKLFPMRGSIHFGVDCIEDFATENDERLAKARLIAAAPHLLSVAQEALDYLTDHGIDLDGEEEAHVAGIRGRLDEAINAAKGNYFQK